ETLAGYGRYQKALMLLNYGEKYKSIAPSFLRDAVRGGVATLPGSLNRTLNRTFLSREADIENLYFDNFSIFSRAMQNHLFSSKTIEQIADRNPYTLQNRLLDHLSVENVLDKLLYADTKTYLHELLMKQDQMSMAAS